MSTLELALNMLAEATTTELTKSENPHGLVENQQVARKGGRVAGNARKEIEKETGKPVITSQNAKQLNGIVTKLLTNSRMNHQIEICEVSMTQLFESDHISFVEVSELLVKDYLDMVNDNENVNRFIGGKTKSITEEQELAWVREKIEEKAPIYSMIEKKSGRFIGNIELMGMTDSEGELGIAINGEMQNQGFGTEAVLALLQYGFDHLGLKRIFLRTNTDNTRAIHVYEKCGFVEYDKTDSHISMEVNYGI